MLDSVLFDLDGTLADTAPDLGGTLNELRRHAGLPALPITTLRPYVSNGVRGLLRIGFGIAPDHPTYAELQQRFLEIYPVRLCVDTCLFQGVPRLLDRLEVMGIAWGIVTNKAQCFALPLVDQLGLARRAACIVSGDSARRPKPYADPLLLAAGMLRTAPSRCLYVGDDLRDVQAARAAAMTSVAATYGYLGASEPVSAWGADHLIAEPTELLALLCATTSCANGETELRSITVE